MRLGANLHRVLHYPAISGTASMAAKIPTAFQRVKCYRKIKRASNTVIAG